MAQRLPAHFQGNKFKTNALLTIKLARAAFFMLKHHSVFDPECLAGVMFKK